MPRDCCRALPRSIGEIPLHFSNATFALPQLGRPQTDFKVAYTSSPIFSFPRRLTKFSAHNFHRGCFPYEDACHRSLISCTCTSTDFLHTREPRCAFAAVWVHAWWHETLLVSTKAFVPCPLSFDTSQRCVSWLAMETMPTYISSSCIHRQRQSVAMAALRSVTSLELTNELVLPSVSR